MSAASWSLRLHAGGRLKLREERVRIWDQRPTPRRPLLSKFRSGTNEIRGFTVIRYRMPRRDRPCSVCQSPHATSVALDVTRGETLSSIAKRYGFSLMAVSRHRTNCLGVDEGEARQVAKAVNRRIIDAALPTRENLIGRLEDVSSAST